jgi:cysteinyl-tRNA synthetase
VVSFLNGKFREPVISEEVSKATLVFILTNFRTLVLDILGLKDEKAADADALLDVVMEFYKKAKAEKDYAQVDAIRAALKKQNLVLKDSKTGVDWSYE